MNAQGSDASGQQSETARTRTDYSYYGRSIQRDTTSIARTTNTPVTLLPATAHYYHPKKLHVSILETYATWRFVIIKYLETSNVTGRYRGPKLKLRAGYRAPSLNRTFYLSSSSVTDAIFFIAECGIARFLCAMRVFEVRASSSPQRHLCAKFRFCRGLHCWASPWRKIAYSITHSLIQSLSLFDTTGTEAFASEQVFQFTTHIKHSSQPYTVQQSQNSEWIWKQDVNVAQGQKLCYMSVKSEKIKANVQLNSMV